MKFKLGLLLTVGMLSGCMENKLPECDDSKVKNVVMERMSYYSTLGLGREIQVTALEDIQETGYNKELGIRTCSARPVSTRTTNQQNPADYTISWINEEKGTFKIKFGK